jgi:hypothetical protein
MKYVHTGRSISITVILDSYYIFGQVPDNEVIHMTLKGTLIIQVSFNQLSYPSVVE